MESGWDGADPGIAGISGRVVVGEGFEGVRRKGSQDGVEQKEPLRPPEGGKTVSSGVITEVVE